MRSRRAVPPLPPGGAPRRRRHSAGRGARRVSAAGGAGAGVVGSTVLGQGSGGKEARLSCDLQYSFNILQVLSMFLIWLDNVNYGL